jgi:membrane protease YdiL (CAAX protease family)
VIFIILANLPVIIFASVYGENVLSGGWYTALVCFSPAIANVLTRLITKEGFKNNYLRGNFKGNMKYYVYGIIFAVVCSVLALFFILAFFGRDIKLSNMNINLTSLAVIILSVVNGITVFWISFGEEFGWRAYLTPKLETLMPKWAALIVSGIIWGLWHAPMIYYGLNFGTSYKGYPYAGYAVMCVSCIFYGCFLTFLTDKTNSVYPASVCHACVDSMMIPQLILPNFDTAFAENGFLTSVLYVMPHIIVGGVFFVMLVKGKKNAAFEK